MVGLYKILNLILIILFVLCFFKLKKNGYAFTPIFSFYIGLVYFILFPFTVLTFVEEFSLNPLSGATGYWTSVNLNDLYYLYPYMVIWFSLILCGLVILIFARKLPSHKKNSLFIKSTDINKITFILKFSIFFLIVDWFVKFLIFGGISNYLSYHWYMRNDILFNKYGTLFVYLTKFTQANMIIFTGLSVLFTLRLFSKESTKNKKTLFLTLILLIIHLLIIFLTGNRIYFAIFLLLIFMGFIIYNYKKQIIISIISLPVLLMVFSAWSYTRSQLFDLNNAIQSYFDSLKELNNAFVSMLFDISEGSNILIAFHIINDYGKIYELLSGSTYFRVFTSFIPGFSNKVDSFTVIIGKNYMPGTNVSLNSTIIGELYANFGLLLLIFLPLVSIFFILISTKVNVVDNPIVTFSIGCLICWFVRSIFSDNFLISIIVLSIIFAELILYRMLIELSNPYSKKYYKVQTPSSID